jgi:tetratricopeptide (TPR) repeat protein
MRHLACLTLTVLVGCASGGAGRSSERPVEIEPARLVPTRVANPGSFKARIRVYTDAGYRSQNPAHEQQLRTLLAGAFRILAPTIGVDLGEVEFRSWERQAGSDLPAMLAELEALDAGDDVDWVLGFVDAQGHVAADVHQLGEARVLGRHAVLRGLNDAAEVTLLEAALRGMSSRERQALYGRRKHHKELVLLLHEMGHTLGAMHVTGVDRIMAPSYEASQSSFEGPNARLMAAAAQARFGGNKAEPDREARVVLEHIRKHPWSGWNEDERDRLVTELEARVKSIEEGTAGMPLGNRVRAEDREKFRAAERLLTAGRPADAWEELEPLIEFYPDEASVQVLSCRVAVAAGKDRALVARRCQRGMELAPTNAEPQLRLAQASLAAKEMAKAYAAADAAHRQLAGMTPALKKELAHVWKELGAVSRAEEAGTGDAELATWARALRSRYGMAPGAVPPDKEAAFVAAIRDLLKLVYARKFDAAEKRAAELRKEFGDAAGIDASLCDLEVRRKKYPAARALCEKAIKRYADEAWAHYLLGLLDKHDKKPDAAIQHLVKAIALDPELENAYQVTAGLYDAGGKKDEAAKLRKAYKEQFGRDLP